MSNFQTWSFKPLVSYSSLTDQKNDWLPHRFECLLVFFLDWLHFKWHCKGATQWQSTTAMNRRGKQNEDIEIGIVGWRLCSCGSDSVLIRHCSWLVMGGWAGCLGCELWKDMGHSHMAISILLWLLSEARAQRWRNCELPTLGCAVVMSKRHGCVQPPWSLPIFPLIFQLACWICDLPLLCPANSFSVRVSQSYAYY